MLGCWMRQTKTTINNIFEQQILQRKSLKVKTCLPETFLRGDIAHFLGFNIQIAKPIFEVHSQIYSDQHIAGFLDIEVVDIASDN